MKLVCPKCLSNLKVPESKIPVGGGWARCPRCTERFFVKAPGAAIDFSQPPAGAPGAPPKAAGRARDQASQRLIDRLRKSKGDDDAGGMATLSPGSMIFTEITIFPEPAPSPLLYQIIGGALLLLPIILISAFFFGQDEPSSGDSAETVAAVTHSFNDDRNEDLIRSDMIKVRQAMVRQKRLILSGKDSNSGSESRVFRYFSERLVPGACEEISFLRIENIESVDGYSFLATCNGSTGIIKMNVTWNKRMATVGFPGFKVWEEMEVYPLLPMSTSAEGRKKPRSGSNTKH